MKYQYSNDAKEIVISFDKSPENQMMLLFELIRTELSQLDQPSYFIAIDGLESTIDTFVESCNSNNYRLYDNGKHNWLIKNFPTLCLLSEDWHDITIFYKFIGSFNEGSIQLYFIDSQICLSLSDEDQKDKLFANINDHCRVQIDILSDGDVFKITSKKTRSCFERIINWLAGQNAEAF